MDTVAKLDGTAATKRDTPPESAAPARASRRPLLMGAGGVLLVGAAVWGVRWWTVGRFIQGTDDAYLKADSVIVAPKVSGYVAEVYVADNQTVGAGEQLVRLDGRQYQAALEQANATIAARKADIERSQAELTMQAANIAQARAQVAGAVSGEAHAASEVTRYEPLVKSGAESTERLSELRNTYNQAHASLAAAQAQLTANERQPATLQAQIDQARAQLAAAEALARQAQLDMQDTVVRSTLAGRIGDRAVRVGQYAQPGTRLMTIVPVQDVYLEANFKETQIGLMRAGQPASVHVDALPGVELHGTVVSLSPGTGSQFALLPPQNATGNFTKIVQRVPVRIRLEVDALVRPVLVPGLSVSVRVDTRSGRSSGTAQVAREVPHG
jgi:membrane fusion protein (multidrug efflux system)